MRILIAAFAALTIAAPAAAQTFDFDDIALPPVNPATGLGLVTQEIGAYRGFDFFGIGAMSSLAPIFGSAAAAGSGSQYGFVGSGGLGALYRFDLIGFNFYSAFLSFRSTTADSDPAQIMIRGYRSSDTDVASINQLVTLSSTGAQFTFDFGAIQQLEIETVSGNGYVGIDDLSVSTVPEPMTMVLFATGLAAMGGVHLRRRKAA